MAAPQYTGTPASTPAPPRWSANLKPAKFITDYEFWCTASNLYDEDVISAKFAFCFTDDLREAVMTSYKSQPTWAAMKQECLQLLKECSTVTTGDYSSARALFDGTDTYQKYQESVSMFRMRWNQILADFTAARQTHGLTPWSPKDELIEFYRRILPSMHSHCLKHRNSIHCVADAVEVIREREQYNREVKTAQQQRAAMSVDPSAAAITAASSFGSDNPPVSASAARGTPLAAPARSSLHGQPDAQLESSATVRTRMWDTQTQALQAAMEDQDKKFREMQKRMERQEEELNRLKAAEKDSENSDNRAASLKQVTFTDRADGRTQVPFPPGTQVPFPPDELPDTIKCYVSLGPNGSQWCLWHNTSDHNTTSCPHRCCRCGGPHTVYVCPTPHNDVKCANCGRKGHVQQCCIWTVLGDFKGLSSHGAQPSPRPHPSFQRTSTNFGQQQHLHGQPPNGSFQDPPYGRQGSARNHDGRGGYNRHNFKRKFETVHGKSLEPSGPTDTDRRAPNFQPAVLNKRLKENHDQLVARITEMTKQQRREQDRLENRLMRAISSRDGSTGRRPSSGHHRSSRSSSSSSSNRRRSPPSSRRRPN